MQMFSTNLRPMQKLGFGEIASLLCSQPSIARPSLPDVPPPNAAWIPARRNHISNVNQLNPSLRLCRFPSETQPGPAACEEVISSFPSASLPHSGEQSRTQRYMILALRCPSSYAAAYAKGFCQTQDKTSREPLPASVISNSGPTDFIHPTLIIGHTF